MTTHRQKFVLYVIELGDSANDDPAFDHPHRDRGKPCLYVGSTAKTNLERYADHTSGTWTQCRAVRRHGARRLCPELAGNKYAYSREKIEQLEARLAQALRRRGYGVDQH